LREASSDGRGEELTKGDRHVVERNHPAAVLCWSKLRDVEWDDHGSTADTEPNNKAADCELWKMICCRLKNSADDENDAGEEDGKFSAKAVRKRTSNDGANQGAPRGERRDKFLFGGCELVAEGRSDGDKNGADVSSIVA
jgi:hypothetical protein